MNPLLIRRRGMMQAQQGSVLVFHRYLVYDGVHYINTGISLPLGASIYIEDIGYETVIGYQGYYRDHAGQAYTSVRMGCRANNSTDSTKRVLSVRYNSSTSKASVNVPWTIEHFDLWQTPTKIGVDNSYTSYSRGTDVDLNVLALGQDYASSARQFTGKHSNVYVYDSSAANANLYTNRGDYTPIAILRPCKYNGVAGLWIVTTDNPDGYFKGGTFFSVDD